MALANTRFFKSLLSGGIILSVLNLANCLTLKKEYILLSENQILYIYSSLVQVVGALLGLTIAGYSMIDSKMKSLAEMDSSITEYVEDIRHEYYVSLIYIIVSSAIDITICLIVLSVYGNIFAWITSFFMTEAGIVFIFIMLELIQFVCYLNPNAIKEKGSLAKEVIDAEYKENTDKQESSESFSSFITDYNILEKLIKDFASDLVDSQDLAYKMQIFDALNILLRKEIINHGVYSIIDELRRYRNALVHGLDTDKSVNPLIYEKMQEIYQLLKSVYDARNLKDEKVFKKKCLKLINYGKEHGYNEIDRKIFTFLKSHPNASLSEISENADCAFATIRNRIDNLQRIGTIRKVCINGENYWKVYVDR